MATNNNDYINYTGDFLAQFDPDSNLPISSTYNCDYATIEELKPIVEDTNGFKVMLFNARSIKKTLTAF